MNELINESIYKQMNKLINEQIYKQGALIKGWVNNKINESKNEQINK